MVDSRPVDPAARPRAAFVVPRRMDGGERDRLWTWTRARWEREMPDVPIVEGHHAGPGLFNRSEACNRGRAGIPDGTDVIVCLDADVWLDPNQVRQAIALAAATGRVVVGFEWWYGLNEAGTARIVGKNYRGDWRPFIRNRYHDSHSALVAVPTWLWDQVGGFDPRFVGWGLEDSAFVLATDIASRAALSDSYQPGRPRVHGTFGWRQEPHLRIDGDCWHLWHPRSDQARTDEREGNRPLFERYQAAHDLADVDLRAAWSALFDLLDPRDRVAS